MNTISWLCTNQPFDNMRLMSVADGNLCFRSGPGYQGHDGQLVCVLVLSRVPADYPLMVDKTQLTVGDLVELEKKPCRPGTELSFKLVGLSYYLEIDAEWQNRTQKRELVPEGHALRALALYDEYVFGGRPGERHMELAETRH